MVTTADLRTAVQQLGLAGRALCLHVSLRSFGPGQNPQITHCGQPGCRCDDAVLGGPILPEED